MLATMAVLLFLFLILILLSSVIIELLKIRRKVESIERLTQLSVGAGAETGTPSKP